jgi:hypothetical protein
VLERERERERERDGADERHAEAVIKILVVALEEHSIG